MQTQNIRENIKSAIKASENVDCTQLSWLLEMCLENRFLKTIGKLSGERKTENYDKDLEPSALQPVVGAILAICAVTRSSEPGRGTGDQSAARENIKTYFFLNIRQVISSPHEQLTRVSTRACIRQV